MWRALETKISAENGDKETDKLLKMMINIQCLHPPSSMTSFSQQEFRETNSLELTIANLLFSVFHVLWVVKTSGLAQ